LSIKITSRRGLALIIADAVGVRSLDMKKLLKIALLSSPTLKEVGFSPIFVKSELPFSLAQFQ